MEQEYSDPVFSSATVFINNSKSATFSAITYNQYDSITVTSVKLYKKDANNTWAYEGDLPVPTDPSTTPVTYAATADYSAYIESGTYRIRATFCAGDYSLIRYSYSNTY